MSKTKWGKTRMMSREIAPSKVSLRMLDQFWGKGSQSEYGHWIWPCNGPLFPSLFPLLFSLKLYFHLRSCLCVPWWVWQRILPFCIFRISLTILFHQSGFIFYPPHLIFALSLYLSYSCHSFALFFFCQLKKSNNTSKKEDQCLCWVQTLTL